MFCMHHEGEFSIVFTCFFSGHFSQEAKNLAAGCLDFHSKDPLVKGLSLSDWPADGHLFSLGLSLKPEGGI